MSVSESREQVARDVAELIEAQGRHRCAICAWPLAESMEKGCVRGNCSMRGGSEHEERVRTVIRERIKANAEIVARALAACALETRDATIEEIASFAETHYCVIDATSLGGYKTESRPKHPNEPFARAIRALIQVRTGGERAAGGKSCLKD